jgi:Iap family predicted aminopeptidase
MAHVRRLASFGIHDAGSERERRAARYVMSQMKKAGLSVTSEPFTFHSFTLDDAALETATEHSDIVKLAFNPYSAASPISGDIVVLTATDPHAILKMDLDNRIVVVADDNSFKVVSIFKRPRAVLSLSAHDFERLRASGANSAEIRFRGKFSTAKSANVVGLLAAKRSSREIILSAHYDSVRGPGANDNATGVAALLELARYFRGSKLPPDVSLRFVAFGSEEAGLLGSKAYLQKHQAELKNCELLFNIDEIGGDQSIHVDTGAGVKGVPDRIESQLPSELTDRATNDIKDPDQKWRLLSSGDRALWTSSNVPEWLRSVVSRANAGLGGKVTAQSSTGSDHRVFVQAGVVATDVGSDGGAPTHAPTDVPEAVNADNVELAARLVLAVVQDVLRSDPTKIESK